MDTQKAPPAASPPLNTAARRWSVVIPAYNEERFLAVTLDSIARQTVTNAAIILVDNASTDATRAVMERFACDHPQRVVVIVEDLRPGKINALETGIAVVETEFVALCDADTIYPPPYLQRAEAMMDARDGAVAAFAIGVSSGAGRFKTWLAKTKGAIVGALLSKQCHVGGFGHAFRTQALRRSGGYSSKLWPYLLEDHEVVNRIVKLGSIAYSRDHWCAPSSRRITRGDVDWTLQERLLYNLTPHVRKDWFFYEYLRPRFERRKFFNTKLRQRDWDRPAP